MDYQNLRKVSSMFNAIYKNAEKSVSDEEMGICIDKFEKDLTRFDEIADFTDK